MNPSLNIIAGLALLAAAAGGFGLWQHEAAGRLRDERDQARAEVSAARDALERANRAVEAEAAQRADRDALVARLRKGISDAQDEDCGVAPVLRDTLDGLRSKPGGR